MGNRLSKKRIRYIAVRLVSGAADGTLFDFPPSHPDGTRSFLQQFHPPRVVARAVGDCVEVTFNGMKLGIFEGSVRYVFYPGSSLIEQVAVLNTWEPDTAYYYDAGLQTTASEDRSPGN